MRWLAVLGLLAPVDIASADEMRRGAVRAEGTLTCATPLCSPIDARPCAGYLYHASHLGWRTIGPDSRKTLLRAIVYAQPLALHLDSGQDIPLVPRKCDDLDPNAHQRLSQRDLPGFLAKETLLLTDSPVRVFGAARCSKGNWSIVFDHIVRL